MTKPLLRFALFVGIAVFSMDAVAADLRRPPSPTPVLVQPATWTSGFYFGGRQGIGTARDTSFGTDGGDTNFKSKYDLALRSGLVVGYNFGPVWSLVSPRLELEGGYSNFSVKQHAIQTAGVIAAAGTTDSFGDLRATSGLINGYLDLNLGQLAGARPNDWLWRIKPFVGAGIGASHVTLRRQGTSDTGVVMDGSDTRMTWHASAGIGYQFSDNITFELGYRHIRTEGLSFTARDGTASKTDLVNNLMTIGVRRSF